MRGTDCDSDHYLVKVRIKARVKRRLATRPMKSWNVAVVCPIHKKDDPQICNNYRGIALVNVV